ncbi:hypothetical protein ALC62_12716, partial [Cyphomyrmex costatus]
VLALSETWLRERDDSTIYAIKDYYLLRSDRTYGLRGGGVAVYISSTLLYSLIDLLVPLASSAVEIVGAYIHLHKKRIAIFSIYRPPQASIAAIHDLEACLSSVFCSIDYIVCMGDLNIDLLNSKGTNAHYLHNIISLYLMKQIIDTPTRVTRSCASLLDLMFLSCDLPVLESGVCDDVDVSDHRLIYAY